MIDFRAALLGLAVSLATLAAPAQALTYVIDFKSTSGFAPFHLSARVTAANAINAIGGHDVTGVTGIVDGDTIAGLIANPDLPNTVISPSGNYSFNNILFTTGPLFDLGGLLFFTVGGREYNLYDLDGSVLSRSVYSVRSASVTTRGILTAAAVPEPGTWLMLVAGFGLVGSAARRRAAVTC